MLNYVNTPGYFADLFFIRIHSYGRFKQVLTSSEKSLSFLFVLSSGQRIELPRDTSKLFLLDVDFYLIEKHELESDIGYLEPPKFLVFRKHKFVSELSLKNTWDQDIREIEEFILDDSKQRFNKQNILEKIQDPSTQEDCCSLQSTDQLKLGDADVRKKKIFLPLLSQRSIKNSELIDPPNIERRRRSTLNGNEEICIGSNQQTIVPSSESESQGTISRLNLFESESFNTQPDPIKSIGYIQLAVLTLEMSQILHSMLERMIDNSFSHIEQVLEIRIPEVSRKRALLSCIQVINNIISRKMRIRFGF